MARREKERATAHTILEVQGNVAGRLGFRLRDGKDCGGPPLPSLGRSASRRPVGRWGCPGPRSPAAGGRLPGIRSPVRRPPGPGARGSASRSSTGSPPRVSSIVPRPRSWPRCSTKDGTWARSARGTASFPPGSRCGNGATRSPTHATLGPNSSPALRTRSGPGTAHGGSGRRPGLPSPSTCGSISSAATGWDEGSPNARARPWPAGGSRNRVSSRGSSSGCGPCTRTAAPPGPARAPRTSSLSSASPARSGTPGSATTIPSRRHRSRP